MSRIHAAEWIYTTDIGTSTRSSGTDNFLNSSHGIMQEVPLGLVKTGHRDFTKYSRIFLTFNYAFSTRAVTLTKFLGYLDHTGGST